jgi:hypothetical protein
MEAYIALLDSTRSNRTDLFDSYNKSIIIDLPVEGCRISACEDQPPISVCFTKFDPTNAISTLYPPPSSNALGSAMRNLCAITTSTT